MRTCNLLVFACEDYDSDGNKSLRYALAELKEGETEEYIDSSNDFKDLVDLICWYVKTEDLLVGRISFKFPNDHLELDLILNNDKVNIDLELISRERPLIESEIHEFCQALSKIKVS